MNVKTELTITGKIAQFGRGAISDVSGKLMTQFANNLEELLDSGDNNRATTLTGNNLGDKKETELNLLSVVAVPVLKRFAVPLMGIAIILFMVIRYVIL